MGNVLINLLENTGVLPRSPIPTDTSISQRLYEQAELSKNPQRSAQGLAQNTGLNLMQLALGIPLAVEGAQKLQSEYGTPNQLLASDPLKYLTTMAAAPAGYVKHLSTYTPLQDILEGNIQNYPQRVTQQMYENPVTTMADVMALVGLARTLKANPEAIAKANAVKEADRVAAFKKSEEAARSAEMTQLMDKRQDIEGSMGRATGTTQKQIRKARKQNVELGAEQLGKEGTEKYAQGRLSDVRPEKIIHKSSVSKKSYEGLQHEAPLADGGAPLYDVSGKWTENQIYPDDIYGPNAVRYYGHGSPESVSMDNQSISLIKQYQKHPNKPITIYRAVRKDIKGGIQPGDWVSINRSYAKDHGISNIGSGNYKIITKTVYGRDIFTDGNSIHEWGYDPQPYIKFDQMPFDLLPKRIQEKINISQPPTTLQGAMGKR